jgi:hypothetical protein
LRELKGYSFGKCGTDGNAVPPIQTAHLYRFTTSKRNSYIVRVEQFRHEMYVLKFYLKAHRHSKLKYVILTGLNDNPRLIIETCIRIGHEILRQSPNASFGFLGSPTEDEVKRGKGNMLKNTKRFELYRKFASSYFSTDNYIHAASEGTSSYMLINRAVYNKRPEIVKDLETEFTTHYEIEDLFADLLPQITERKK